MRTNSAYTNRKRGVMNKTEAAFAGYLQSLQARGEIASYEYEPESLVLAKGAKYTPDFLVIGWGGGETYYEVKGSKRTPPSKRYPLGNIVPVVKEAARVRFKVAVEKYPECRFIMAWHPRKDFMGPWMEKEYSVPAGAGERGK